MNLLEEIVTRTSISHLVTDGKTILYCNPAFAALTGRSAAQLQGAEAETVFPAAALKALQAPAGADGAATRIETQITSRSGRIRDVLVDSQAFAHRGQPLFLWTLTDISELKDREDELRRSEAKYKTVFEFAPDVIVVYNTEGKAIDVNPRGLEVSGGLSRDEAIMNIGTEETWCEEDRARFEEIRKQTLETGEWSGEITGIGKNGEEVIVESRVKVAQIEDETAVICMSRDITERKRLEREVRNSLKEKETLLREIHHRVKNNMQIISSLLNLQAKNAPDEATRALFRESQNRILSMAMIHEKLYQSEGLHKIDLKDYVTDLAYEVRASFGRDAEATDLVLDIDDIVLGMDTAIPCGLIIIELLSNALKYAFPKTRAGKVSIGLKAQGEGVLTLTVKDNGVGLPGDLDIAGLPSLGLRLVSDLALYQLEGELDIRRGKGTEVLVRFRYETQNDRNGTTGHEET